MRAIDPHTQERLSREAASLSTCWRLTRRDGAEIGLTDHDRDLRFGGTRFIAGGAETRALRSTAELGVDDSEAVGILADEHISEADLTAGRWDGAAVEVWRVDWEDPSARLLLRTGTIGEVTIEEGVFTAEFRSLKHSLSRRTGRVYGRTCDAAVGDARCGVNLSSAALSVSVTLTAPGDRILTLVGAGAFEGGFFSGGTAEVEDGSFAGVVLAIKTHDSAATGDVLTLWQAAPETLPSGTALRLTAGCDKRFETCRAKFSNGLNFRGHPHMPGNDILSTVMSPGEEAS